MITVRYDNSIFYDAPSTIANLLTEHHLQNSKSGMYKISNKQHDQKQIVIGDDTTQLLNEDVVNYCSVSVDECNKIGAAFICAVINKINPKSIKITNVSWSKLDFVVEYSLNKNTKSILTSEFEASSSTKLKSNTFIWFSKDSLTSAIFIDQRRINQDSSLEYWYQLRLSNHLVITGNHALENNDTQKIDRKLIRIRGKCFKSADAKAAYELKTTIMEQNDHREINKKLKLFMFDDQIGSGMPTLLKDGYFIRQQISQYFYHSKLFQHAQFIATPILGLKDLYVKSGHWENYRESMFPQLSFANSKQELVLRPMTCPHHCIVFKNQHYSSRDLPVTFCEDATLFRYEASGALIGLERTRQMTLFDSHTFIQHDKDSIIKTIRREINIMQQVLTDFSIRLDYYRLSLNNSDESDEGKYIKDSDVWKSTSEWLTEALVLEKIPFKIEYGHAAFYGPKIDLQIRTAIGNSITLGTIQLDSNLSKKLECTYDGDQYPVIIHTGFIGTYERFISILLEQNSGYLPMCCSPHQLMIIPVSARYNNDALKFKISVGKYLCRVELNLADNHLNKKIKQAYSKKTNLIVVIGATEVQSKEYNFKSLNTGKIYKIKLSHLRDITKYE